MTLEKVKLQLEADGFMWEHAIFQNEASLGPKENARRHNAIHAWLNGEFADGRHVRMYCLWPNIDRGTQRSFLIHKPGFNVDSLKVPKVKI